MLIFVRHGESKHNAEHIICGAFDSPLTEKGREQARGTAEELRATQIDQAFVSPLERARESLDILLQELGQHPPVTVVPELIERNLGSIVGQREADYSPEQWDAWATWKGKPDGGESYADMQARVMPWLCEVALPLAVEKHVLIMGHNALTKVIRQAIEHIPREQTSGLNTPNSAARWYTIAPDGSATVFKAPQDGLEGLE